MHQRPNPNRRSILKSSLALLAGGALGTAAEAAVAEPAIKNVNTLSSPSTLKITDMRYAVVVKPGPSPCVIIRIDTNQGVYGLGEVRDIAGPQYAMVLKSRIAGRESAARLTISFRRSRSLAEARARPAACARWRWRFGTLPARFTTSRFTRCWAANGATQIRIYADTTESLDPAEYGRRAKERKAMGLTWMKMDLGINVLEGIPDTVMQPAGMEPWELHDQPHPFIATEVTDKGIDRLCEYVAAVRDNIGYDMPLSMDHLGHIGVKSVIRLGKAYEKFNLEWMEDVIPWYYTDLLKEITEASPTPTLTGEDIYQFSDFETLCKEHAVDKIHPDLATSGGILQTHRIGDMAFRYGVPMAMHFAGTPVSCMASVHCAAATRNFLALENHSLDVPFWQDLVTGIEKPIINKGYIKVPETPGLGVALNDDELKRHLKPGTGYFEPTPMWDAAQSWDDALFS